ncbi:MAG TPA: NepR family anti-sigma factor [Rhodanobacter sp.]
MNLIDDDTLQAYVDGELDAADAARIDRALAHDDVLARRVQQARRLRSQLQAAFNPVLDEPVPDRLAALLRSEPAPLPAPVALPASRPGSGFGHARRGSRRRWFVPSAAVAASVAVLAVAIWWHAGNDLVRVHDGQQFAAGSLFDALEQGLASAPDPRSAVAIGLTFRAADGHICRTFVRRAEPAMAGLACRGESGWALPVISTAVEPANGQLRQAASALPPDVEAAVDARLRGEVFDAHQERAARDAGWR